MLWGLGQEAAAPEVTDSDQPAWWDLWGKLKIASDDLDKSIAALQAQRAWAMTRPDLAQEVADREAELRTAKDRLEWVRDAIKSVLGWFGVDLSGLGFLPLIPIAVAAGAVAYIASQAAETWALAKRIEEQRRLEERGVSPSEAARIVQSNATAGTLSSTLSNARGLLWAAGFLGAGVIAYRLARRRGWL